MRAGKECFRGFMNRHPSSQREPKAASMSRPESQIKENINEFFSKVTLVMNDSGVFDKKIVYNDRIIAIKLQAEPINILMIQVYMPTSEHEDDEVEELYGVIEEILEEDGKGNTNTIITGDWNSVVGDEPYRNIVGPHGLGRKNHRGQMLINFSERNGLIVTNTWFKKPKRRLYT